MFKWVCLAVATAGLAIFLWLVNDIRLQVAQITANVNRQLPQLDQELPRILRTTEQAVQVVNQHLPRIISQTDQAGQSLGELARDVKDLKKAIRAALAKRPNLARAGR
jgi:hypothetical protein